LGLEGGFHIPIGKLEPYITVGAGYASLGSFSSSAPASSQADIKGFNARVGAGLDYYLSNTFSLGANLSGDVLFLSRSKVADAAASTSGDEAAIYAKDESSIGAGATLTAVVGLHF
jgi:outer membrane protein W